MLWMQAGEYGIQVLPLGLEAGLVIGFCVLVSANCRKLNDIIIVPGLNFEIELYWLQQAEIYLTQVRYE